MNLTKQTRIRREILTADRIFGKVRKEILSYLKVLGAKPENTNIKTFINNFMGTDITDDEKQSILNEIGERLAFACEHYLKALIIPHIRFNNVQSESNTELDMIFNSKKDGIKKYSHYFSKILLSSDSALPRNLCEHIIIALAWSLNSEDIRQELKEYSVIKLILDPNASQKEYEKIEENREQKKQVLIDEVEEIIKKNDDAYPQSRYGMFTDYIADIDFLYCFCECLCSTIGLAISNNYYAGNMSTRIFYDSNSTITKVYENDITDIFNVDANGIIQPRPIDDFGNDICPISLNRPYLKVLEYRYVENGVNKVLKFDDRLGLYVSFNDESGLSLKQGK